MSYIHRGEGEHREGSMQLILWSVACVWIRVNTAGMSKVNSGNVML